jgi:uncharacterized protein YjdB
MLTKVKGLSKISIIPTDADDVLLLENFMNDYKNSARYKFSILTDTNLEGEITELILDLALIIPTTGIVLPMSTVTIPVGSTYQLIPTIFPALPPPPTFNPPSIFANRGVTFVSSNPTAITVDESGLVSAREAGTATITVKTDEGNFTATCTITVPYVATGVTITQTTVNVAVGATVQLTTTVLPSSPLSTGVTYTSSDDTIATVDSDGLVTGVLAGTATITVTTDSGSFTDTCDVTVT